MRWKGQQAAMKQQQQKQYPTEMLTMNKYILMYIWIYSRLVVPILRLYDWFVERAREFEIMRI